MKSGYANRRMSRRPSALPGFSVAPFEERLERWQRWQSRILLGLIVLLPWATVPVMADGVEWPRVFLSTLAVLGVLFFAGIAWRRGGIFFRRDSTLALPIALLLVAVFAFFRDGTIAEKAGSFLGPMGGGLVLSSGFLLLAGGLFIMGRVTKGELFLTRALWALGISHVVGSIVTLVGLFQRMNGKSDSWFPPGGGAYSYALFSIGIWWACAFIWSQASYAWQKRLLGALMISSCLVTVFFASVFREWWAAVLLVVPLVFAGMSERLPRRIAVIAGLIVVVTLVSALFVVRPLFVARLSWSASWQLLESVSGRSRWVGALDWQQAFAHWRPAELSTAALDDVVFDRSYNLPLSFAITHGRVGAVFVLLIILWVLAWAWRYRRDQNEPWLAMAIGVFLGTLFVSPHVLVMSVLFLALGLATRMEFEEERGFLSHRPVLRDGVIVAGIALGVAVILLLIGRSTLEAALAQNKEATGMARRVFQVVPSIEQRFLAQAIASEGQAIATIGATDRVTAWSGLLRLMKNEVKRSPQQAGSWELLARVYHLLQPYVEGADVFGLEAIDKAIFLAPTNARLFVVRGNILFATAERQEQERETVDTKVRESLEIGIRDAYRRAAEAYGRALVIRQDDDAWRYQYAVALGRAGFITQAREQLEQILARKPRDASIYTEAAVLAMSEKQPDRAIEWLKEALDMNASLWQAAVLLSDVYKEKKEFARARAVLQALPTTTKELPVIKERLKRLEWEASSVRPVPR